MARILVAGNTQHIAARDLRDRLVAAVRDAGHDGAPLTGLAEVQDADGLLVLLDACDPLSAAALGMMHQADKPRLGLGLAPGPLADACSAVCLEHADDALGHLESFFEMVKPFAGRVVRDKIPELVRDAGHDVAFREVTGEDRPRFLKQKVANEAQELLRADVGKEKEEIADVLEALEAFIRSRGVDREDLKRIKDGKRKRRGGFDKVYVVESTA